VTVYVIEGRPNGIRTSAVVTCPTKTYVQWMPGPLTVRKTSTRDYGGGWIGHGTTTVSSRVEDDSVTGTLQSIQNISGPGPPVLCDSGSVTFTAQR
jgi:hypothetical protein